VIDSARYLLILAACAAVTLPLEFGLGARVYRRPRTLAAVLLPVVAMFAAWDVVATARGHWWFDDRYVLGVRLLGLPIEEWLFFVVVPVSALLTFEALGQSARRLARARVSDRRSTVGDRHAR
jgi:lycopene beta-cyclase